MAAKICIILFLMLVCEGAQNKYCSDMQSQCNKKCEEWGKYAAGWCKHIASLMTLTCKARFVDACDYAHNCCKKDYERRKKMKDCTDMEKRGKLYCDSNEETLKNTLADYLPPPPQEKECTIECGKEYTECLESRRNNQWNHTSLSSGDWRKKTPLGS